MLRIKKPQSPFLSRVIRDKIKQRQKRITKTEDVEELVRWAQAEDTWETEIEGVAAAEGKEVGMRGQEGWKQTVKNELQRLTMTHGAGLEKARKIALKMGKIVDQERELLAKEKGERTASKKERSGGRKGNGGESNMPGDNSGADQMTGKQGGASPVNDALQATLLALKARRKEVKKIEHEVVRKHEEPSTPSSSEKIAWQKLEETIAREKALTTSKKGKGRGKKADLVLDNYSAW